jgi:hypothetical protein
VVTAGSYLGRRGLPSLVITDYTKSHHFAHSKLSRLSLTSKFLSISCLCYIHNYTASMKLPLLTRDSGKPPAFLRLRSSAGLIVTTVSFAVFTVGIRSYVGKNCDADDFQDVFLYAVIVPVLPFSMSTRVGVAEDKGKSTDVLNDV